MRIANGVMIVDNIGLIIDKLIRKAKQKWNSYKNKWLLVPLVAIFLYLSGIIAQIAYGRSHWVPGELTPKVRLNPLSAFLSLFSAYGIRSTIGVFLIVIVTTLIIYLYRPNRTGQTYDKKRNVWYSDKGTHGTAHWLTDSEQKEVFDITPTTEIETIDDVIYGITEDDEIISRRSDSGLNRHIAVFGASGTKKSRAFVRNQIITCALRGEAVVVTDPKGELASDTTSYLEEIGYEVKILNMVKPRDSHRFDALFRAGEDSSIVNKITSAIIRNTGGETGGAFHDKAESNLLNALIFFELQFPTNGKYPTLGAAYNRLLTCDDFEKLKNDIYACGRTSRAARAYSLFHNSSDNLKGNVINGLGSRLEILQNEEVEELVSYPDMDFRKLRTEKCAYFLIISDQDESMRFISALFISLFFLHLVEYADFESRFGITSIPVNLILDEAMNIGYIAMFDTRLATVRSRLINIYTIFQDIGQLQNRYPGTWSSILGNSAVKIFLGCTDLLTAQYISDFSGDASVVTESSSRNMSELSPLVPLRSSVSQSTMGRKLLTPGQVLTMDNNDCLILVGSEEIMEAKKFDYSRHPESRLFSPIDIQGVMKKEVSDRTAMQTHTNLNVDHKTGEVSVPKPENLPVQKKQKAKQILGRDGKPIKAQRTRRELDGQMGLYESDIVKEVVGNKPLLDDTKQKTVVTMTEKPSL